MRGASLHHGRKTGRLQLPHWQPNTSRLIYCDLTPSDDLWRVPAEQGYRSLAPSLSIGKITFSTSSIQTIPHAATVSESRRNALGRELSIALRTNSSGPNGRHRAPALQRTRRHSARWPAVQETRLARGHSLWTDQSSYSRNELTENHWTPRVVRVHPACER